MQVPIYPFQQVKATVIEAKIIALQKKDYIDAYVRFSKYYILINKTDKSRKGNMDCYLYQIVILVYLEHN